MPVVFRQSGLRTILKTVAESRELILKAWHEHFGS